MWRSKGVVLLVVPMIAVTVVGCGDASDDDGKSATAATRTARIAPARTSDAARAQAALLRLSDLPPGWVADRGAVTRLRCGGFQPFGRASALVSTRRLTQENAGVQERIAIYPDAAAARRALRRLDSRPAANCLRRELRRHVSREAEAPAGPARLVRYDKLGPLAHSTRYISVSVNAYGKVIGFIDAMHERYGRILAALVFVNGPQPPDQGAYDRIVARVSQRLRGSLG